jgi:5-hydroxyisourate hydrolase-like protein (transthyretin family)
MNYIKGGKIVGEIFEDSYITKRRPPHFMRMFQGFGISQAIIDDLKEKGIKFVTIIYTNNDGDVTRYRMKLQQFIDSDYEFTFDETDHQRFVKVVDMELMNRTPNMKFEKDEVLF